MIERSFYRPPELSRAVCLAVTDLTAGGNLGLVRVDEGDDVVRDDDSTQYNVLLQTGKEGAVGIILWGLPFTSDFELK